MEDVGIRRGIVISNDDPEYRGRCKIFVPGIYPEEFSKTPENLPWAEPAMSLFGGGWKSNTGKKNNNANAQKPVFEETGICSVPHAGINGDGAQVWVFFDSGDIRRPIYFAVAQTGTGWFSKHNNQHVISTDNVKIIVDEYDTYSPIQQKNDNVSDKLAGDVSDRQPQDLKNDISNVGGVSEVKSLYDGAGGTHKAFDFMNSAGGSSGLQKISDTCSNGLNSLVGFLDSAGGSDSMKQFLGDCGGFDNIKDALDGKPTVGGNQALTVIKEKYGSVEDFQTKLAQVGGIDGFRSITESFQTENGFFDAVESIGGNKGLASLASMEAKLGGSGAFKEWNDGFKKGADGVDSLINGKTAEDKLKEAQENTKQKENETITKSTTYTRDASGYGFIKSVTQESRKTRLKIQIETKKDKNVSDVALDLSIKGDVNMKIDGDLYREITGNIYDTILGDHHVYRKQGYFLVQDGDESRFISGKKIEKVSQSVDNIREGGEKNFYNGNIDFNFAQAVVNYKLKGFNIDAENFISLNANNININGSQNVDVATQGNMSFNASKKISMISSLFSSESQEIILNSLKNIWIKAIGKLSLMSSSLVEIIGKDNNTPKRFLTSAVKIITDCFGFSAGVSSNFAMGGKIVETVNSSTAVPTTITKNIMATTITKNVVATAIAETITAPITRTIVGAVTENITGAVTKSVTGAETHTVSTTYALTSTGAMTLTGTAGIALITNSESGVVTLTGSGGTVTFTGAKTTVIDTPAGTGGGGTFAIVG